jgi:hypothetical protein
MRVSVVGLFACCFAAALYAQAPPLPKDHPAVSSPDNRQRASEITERLRPSANISNASRLPRKNLIDEFVFSKMEKDGVPNAPLSSDEEFFRRVHIDLTGRIPGDEELRAFRASTDADKRDKLIDQLAASPAAKAKWTYFFGDLFKSAANRIGNEGKNVFYRWIYDNIHLDRPYNLMVRDMLTAKAASNWYVGPAGYVARWVVVGVKCEDTVHEDTSDELAINAVKQFFGVDLNCVSCHDGRRHLEKINTWLTERKRDQLYQMGAFFAKTRVLRRVEVATTQDEYSIDDEGPGYDASARTVVRVPRRGTGKVEPVFMFTGESPDPAQNPRLEFARMLTSHPQFARATANLLWAEMFGVGIVDPPLDFDLARIDPANPPPAPWTLQPTHPELLDALGNYFRENNYSLRSVIKLIAKSNAYQLSSNFPGEWKASHAKYFARHFVRRLKAEEIHDSLVHATGLYTDVPIRGTDFRARYATETRSPEDFKGRSNELKEINFFLESFGQTNREYSERTNEGDITQAILLMNSPFVLRQIKFAPGSFLAKLLNDASTDEEKITRLFERFLVRRPSRVEMAQARPVVAAGSRKGWEDLQWLLVNKLEFVHNF